MPRLSDAYQSEQGHLEKETGLGIVCVCTLLSDVTVHFKTFCHSDSGDHVLMLRPDSKTHLDHMGAIA